MLSLKDTRDFLLLSYDMKLIKDDEFGHVRLVHQSLIYHTIPFLRLTWVSWTNTTLSFRLIRISGCVLKSNVNRIKSRTAKIENKKSKLACEGRSKISLVLKFILRLIFKRLHPTVSCLHPQRKMRKFRALGKSKFFPRSSPCCVGFVVRFCRTKMWETQQNHP